jgi:hypothetical protein
MQGLLGNLVVGPLTRQAQVAASAWVSFCQRVIGAVDFQFQSGPP